MNYKQLIILAATIILLAILLGIYTTPGCSNITNRDREITFKSSPHTEGD